MSFLLRAAVAACLAASTVFALATPSRAAGLALDIVADTHSGLAIDGYDPVAYYMGQAEKGSEDFTFMWGDVAWRFANKGNMAAFAAAPEIYAPAFGGYCAVSVARGERAEGDPRLFVVHRGRTYLFFSEDNRERFLLSPDGMAMQARKQWLAIAPLAPPELTPAALPRR